MSNVNPSRGSEASATTPAINSDFFSLDELIYAPLYAISRANIDLATNIVSLMSESGDIERKSAKDIIHLKNIDIAYSQIKNAENNTNVLEEVSLKIPLISVIPLSNLQVNKAKIKFDAEVRNSTIEDSPSILDAKICAPKQRDSDFIPKVHFNIEIASIEAPEGLSRFLDSLHISHIPQRVSSVPLDDNGMARSGEELEYFNKQHELSLKEKRLSNAYENVTAILNEKKVQLDNVEINSIVQNGEVQDNSDLNKRQEEFVKYTELRDALNDRLQKVHSEILANQLDHLSKEDIL